MIEKSPGIVEVGMQYIVCLLDEVISGVKSFRLCKFLQWSRQYDRSL